MELLNQLEELIEQRINELTIQTRTRQERVVLEKKADCLDTVMDQLSEDDKEWLDCELMAISCSKEEDNKVIYKAGFSDSLKIMKLLGI
ncbi:hypothetical protein LJC58_09310 [Lachnospiraceae bacterium OttesenSCG-928-D06]|nr:hypothetical protein [Lachnospiraceae bacterium OttesenSCG-928-D06]